MAEKTIIPVSFNNETHGKLIEYIAKKSKRFGGNNARTVRHIIQSSIEYEEKRREQSESEPIGEILDGIQNQLTEIKAILVKIKRDGISHDAIEQIEQVARTAEEIPRKYADKLNKLSKSGGKDKSQ